MAQPLPQNITDQRIAQEGLMDGFKASPQGGNPLQCAAQARDLNKPVGHSVFASDSTDAQKFAAAAQKYEASGCAVPEEGMNAFTRAKLQESGFSAKDINKVAPAQPKP